MPDKPFDWREQGPKYWGYHLSPKTWQNITIRNPPPIWMDWMEPKKYWKRVLEDDLIREMNL